MTGTGCHFRLRRRPRNADEQILPLINIVFLLLIFFMVAGQLSAVLPFEIDPVESASEEVPHVEDLTVAVGSAGQLALDGEEIARERLEARVREHLAVASGEAVRVRLTADGNVDAVAVVAVMEHLRAAGVETVDLVTIPRP
ncbi:MAG: biopolymer transporter ExbD [Thioalkalivibrio sp.]|nr:biopolymer transporter ExbD [Thioalkalivibrio sp.]